MKTRYLVACGISHRGRARPNNEDAIYLDPEGTFCLLADGMGGHDRGAEASRMAIDIIQEFLSPGEVASAIEDVTDGGAASPEIPCFLSLVGSAVKRANKIIYERNKKVGLNRFMGTTVVGLLFIGHRFALWFHVGDSRLYRWRNATLECLTTDHSAYMAWLLNGKKGVQPKKNIITRAVGPNAIVGESTDWEHRQAGDVYLLCSDGLTDMIPEERIRDILAATGDVEDMAHRLVRAANDAGGKDNISTIVCRA